MIFQAQGGTDMNCLEPESTGTPGNFTIELQVPRLVVIALVLIAQLY